MCPLLLSEWRVSLPLHGHEFFFADDALIGPLLIALPLDNSRSAAVFALCGSLSIPNLSLSPNGPFFPAAQHLPPSLFENLHIRALAVAMLRYFAQIPDNVRRKARIFHEPNSTDQLQISARGGAFDEMHAADIAQRCVPARASLLQSQINKILEQRFTKDLIIDLVLPDTDTTNPCPSTDSFLSIFTDPDDLTTTHDPCVRDSILSPHLPQSGSLQLDSHVTERRVRFFHELVSTEERYVDRLSHLIRDYVVPLRRLGTPSSSYDLKALFPAVLDQISQANSAFYNEIKDVDNELQLATLCSKHFGLFAPLYSKFLEASLDFEIHLENLLRQTRCKEYANVLVNVVKINLFRRKSTKDDTMSDSRSC
ncbi:Rho guanine nucleotide exchange factor gef2 [Neolecta irregularis DAH-3]|uniref:Rho guanine nucleotide exchange factor gef2 n=1 Tax=Neolecta irregularis (strain DAH-3) TaxID=1198029 RepID=A0A1U7LIZ6_NEOID|nr:Rho guanine nucleotide exchange factor gef2 [Neolecta irregularis DAH-3]|eukprot:OLL22522.1 Rho guanine nucleotide exchange factor gef2 [Neolecta irregularis DAH-3]